MTDLQLRIYALETAPAVCGEKANHIEVLRAADGLFFWLKTGQSELLDPRPEG